MSLLELVQPVADVSTALHTVTAGATPLLEATAAHVGGLFPTWDPPKADPQAPPGSGALVTFWGMIKWVSFVVAGIGLVVVGIMFVISKGRGEGHEIAPVLLKWMMGVSIAAASGLLVGIVTTAAGA